MALQGKWDSINIGVGVIAALGKVCGLDKDSVRCINQIFSFATFGMFYDEIKKLMKQEDYLEQYESIVTENSMDNYKSEFVSE